MAPARPKAARRRLAFTAGVLAVVLMLPAAARADTDDAVLRSRCPGLAAWLDARKAGRGPADAEPASAPTLPALREELLRMSEADQAARAHWQPGQAPDAPPPFLAVDARHLPRIKAIVEAQGFPIVAQVGQDGVDAAFLLVQHADADPSFQQRVLQTLAGRYRTGDRSIDGQTFALLTDRVLRAQDRPQRYGTQFALQDGQLLPQPMEEPEAVDRRRADVGLMPLADYACAVKASADE